MSLLMNFFILIFAHYIADYVFQSDFLGTTKGISWYNLFVHCIIYTGTITIVFYLLGYTEFYLIIGILLTTHIIIDKAKCVIGKKYKDSHDIGYGAYNGNILYIDQVLHILILVLLLLEVY